MPIDAQAADIRSRTRASAEQFARTAMLSLGQMFGASRAVFSDRGHGRNGEMHFVNWPSWCKSHYCEQVRARDPIKDWLDSAEACGSSGVARLSDLLPPAALRQIPSDEPLLGSCGARFVLTIALRDRTRIVGALSLVRDVGSADFTEADRALALSLQPMLQMAYGSVADAEPRGSAIGRADENDPLYALTQREREVAELAADGHPNKSIARLLDASPWTIKNHMRAVLTKTGARNRTELSALLGAQRARSR